MSKRPRPNPLMIINAAYVAALPAATIFYAANVLLHLILGAAAVVWLFRSHGLKTRFAPLGIATLLVLPDRPNEARWLRAEERDWLGARLAEERRAKADVEKVTIWQALRHPPVVLLTLGLFFCYTGGYAFWFWMPTMLQRLTGWSTQRVGWIGALPFIVGLVGMLLLGWNSDRTRERRWHFAIPQLTGALALGVSFFLPRSNALLVVVFSLVAFGTIAYLPSFWALPSAFLSNSAAAAAVGFINCTASIGGFVGPKIIGELSQRTGSFGGGFMFMIACWTIASMLVLLCPRERAV